MAMKKFVLAALLLCLTLSGCAVYVPAGPPRGYVYAPAPYYGHGTWR